MYQRGPQLAAHAIHRGFISLCAVMLMSVQAIFQLFECVPSCQGIRIGIVLAKDLQMCKQILENFMPILLSLEKAMCSSSEATIAITMHRYYCDMGTEHTVTEQGFW